VSRERRVGRGGGGRGGGLQVGVCHGLVNAADGDR
jgi:hypothetical protein